MRRTLIVVAALVVLSLIVAGCGHGVTTPTAAGTSVGSDAAKAVRENIHALQAAVMSYGADHNDLFPRYTTEAAFRALLDPYLENGWPTNPYTQEPMRNSRSLGNYSYRSYDDRANFRLIGWGRDGQRIIVVP